MEKRKASQGNNLSKIPEVIDPGITIPIYDDQLPPDDNSGPQQPQKLGSYRTRAGKFSNTLSNLLPSISAKLHHSRKTSGSKSSHPSNETSVSSRSSSSNNSGNITPPHDIDNVIQLPDSANFIVTQPRQSNDSFTFNSTNLQSTTSNTISRTRNNTVSSQITSMSSIPQGNASSSNIWSNNTSPNEKSAVPSTAATVTTSTQFIPSPLNEYSTNTYFDINNGSNNNGNINNLSVPAGNIWGVRTRSQSNASSIYTDAPLYETNAGNRSRASTFAHPLEAHPQMVNCPPAKQQMGPTVADDIDPRSINWVTMDPTVPPINQISNLLPTNTISISNVFSLQQQQPHLANTINLTSTSLATLCLKFGNVLSARTLKGVNMALVEFDSVDAAMHAKEALNGKEVSLVGAPSLVSFAKVLPMHQQPQAQASAPALSGSGPQSLLQEQLYNGAVTFQQQGNVSIPVFNQHTTSSHGNGSSTGSNNNTITSTSSNNNGNNNGNNNHSTTHLPEKEHCPFPLPPPSVADNTLTLKDIISSFKTPYNPAQINHIVSNALNYEGTNDTSEFGPLPDPLATREFDAPKLRELRKMIDANSMSDLEIEQLAVAMLDELPELSSDYLGNTIVQKLFEHSSTIVKDTMLRQTNRYLTSMGVHKNGTWACQKMITMSDTPRQKVLVAQGVEKYCTPLFNDQFGNYVIQCVLKFGPPWNNFIFESIVSNFWIIAQNRYGARAVRACLESHDIITEEQLLVLSGMIVLYAEYLATNTNGALLVTWFLDTCTLPHRHSILAPKLVSHIVDLCCHRLASLTVLKVLNYRGDDNAKKAILDSIFGEKDSLETPQTLYQILNDTNYGPTFIYKVLSMPLLEGDVRMHAVQQVRKVLLEASPAQQHRRLMEEVGLGGAALAVAGTNIKHRPSISHVFATDSSGHMRTVSVSSVRSNGSRPRALSNGAQQPTAQIPVSVPASSQQQQQQLNVPGGYYNYPGMFPMGSSSGGYAVQTDDLSSQFDMLTLSNGTQISLPQLSMNNNQLNTTNNSTGGAYGFGY